jgi:hypothetical protein
MVHFDVTVKRHLWLQAQIENVVEEACGHLPDAIRGQCREFVETYGNAFIALLAQEIDPSVVSYVNKVFVWEIV